MEIKTIRDLVEFAASEYGENDFIRYYSGDELKCITHTEFRDDCLAMCRYIRSINPTRQHIAFIGKTSYFYVVSLTAMIMSGNVVVPFAPDISIDEACVLFDNADIELLFCEEQFVEKGEQIKNKCPLLKNIISLGDEKWFEQIFAEFSTDSKYSKLSDVEINENDLALIIYTSGTTGKRKGVMLSNKNIINNVTYKADLTTVDDVALSVLPMHHVFCYNADVLRTLFDGSVLCLNGELKDLFANLLKFQPTFMRIVPSMAKSLLTRIKVVERKNPQLTKREACEKILGGNIKKFLLGSAFFSPKMIDEFEQYGINARVGYGMSEVSARVTTTDFSDEEKYSTGRLLGTDEVRIVDGEIQVRGDSVMLGYYKMEKETRDAFTPDGFLHTGDLGELRNNHLYLVGRQKNILVLSNGENISPEEIENEFADFDFIKDVLVGIRDEKLVAEIYPNYDLIDKNDINSVIEDAITKINQRIKSDRQIYDYIVRNEPFPRTSTGKILREKFIFK